MSTTGQKNLYLLTRESAAGWDEYRSCVVCAKSEDQAKLVHPATKKDRPVKWDDNSETWIYTNDGRDQTGWVSPRKVEAKLIGIADDSVWPNSVVLVDFNNG